MTIEMLQTFLGWSIVIHFGVLLSWFGMFVWLHDWIYRFHGRWFQVPVERFDQIHYAGMGLYKLVIFVCFVVPYLILLIVA